MSFSPSAVRRKAETLTTKVFEEADLQYWSEQTIPLTINFPTLQKNGQVHVNVYTEIQDALPGILTTLAVSVEDVEGLDFYLFIDNYEGLWVNYGENFLTIIDRILLKSSDEDPESYTLEFKEKSQETKKIKIKGKALPKEVVMEYKETEFVADVLARVLESGNIKQGIKPFSFFYAEKAIWLSDKETVSYYQLPDLVAIEIREYDLQGVIVLNIPILNVVKKYKIDSWENVKVIFDKIIAEYPGFQNLVGEEVGTYKVTYVNSKNKQIEIMAHDKYFYSFNLEREPRITLTNIKYQCTVIEVNKNYNTIEEVTLYLNSELYAEEIGKAIKKKVDFPTIEYKLQCTNGDVVDEKKLISELDLENNYYTYETVKYPVEIEFFDKDLSRKLTQEFRVSTRVPVLTIRDFGCRAFGFIDQDNYIIQHEKETLNLELSLSEQLSEQILKNQVRIVMLKVDENMKFTLPNLWQEDKEIDMIYEKNGSVSAGSFNRLVKLLTPKETVQTSFLQTFLLTYQGFSTADELLCALIERYKVPRLGLSFDEFTQEKLFIRARVCNVLRTWIDSSLDFTEDKELKEKLMNFLLTMVGLDQEFLYNQLRRSLRKSKERIPLTFIQTITLTATDTTQYDANMIFNHRPSDVAAQLSITTFDQYILIKSHELMNQAWSKDKYIVRSQNIRKFIETSNNIGNFVTTTILVEDNIKKRAKKFKFFLEICEHLFNMNNFACMASILGGLNHSSVSRLKKTKKELPSHFNKRMEELEDILNPQGSYRNYRNFVKLQEMPMVPCLPVYLADLIFIDEGNPDSLQELINFGKCSLTYTVIAALLLYQKKRYEFEPNVEIQKILITVMNTTNNQSEKEMYDRSLKLEPRGS